MKKHFTATVYIVSKINGEYKVLLHYHKKLRIWIATGGHIEKDENPIEAVLREVVEETNLKVKILNNKKLLKLKGINEIILPAALVEGDVPAYQDEPFHKHIDLIYFAFCESPKNLKMEEESGWFSKKDLKSAHLNKEVLKFATEVLDPYV